MSWRHAGPGGREGAPTRCPRSGDPRRGAPRLPRLSPAELWAARGAGRGSSWWQDRDAEPGWGSGNPLLSTPPAASPPASLRSLLLPPLQPAARRPRRAAAGGAPDALGGLLGELLPSKFRQFLTQLRAKCGELPELQTPSEPQHPNPSRVSERCPRPPHCPNCPFLPDLWDQPPHFQDSLEKLLLQQKSTLGPPRSDQSQLPTVKKANQLHSTQAPRVKTVPTPSSSEVSGPRRRYCPFRVRFADETLRDTALRYWERNCAAPQNIFQHERTTLPGGSASERAFGSIGRWLESLPKTLDLRDKDPPACSSGWDSPDLSTQELHDYLSEDNPMGRASTHRQQQEDLKTLLEQMGKASSSWSQKLESFLPSLVLPSVLKRGRPKGYQLLLPSATSHQAQR